MVYGPVMQFLPSLSALNTSNQRIRDMVTGNVKSGLGATGAHLWIDVRDAALAHVLAVEKPTAGNKRFLLTQGNYCNREMVDIIRDEFPQYQSRLPEGDALKRGDWPSGGVHGYDNSRSKEILGLQYRSLKEGVVDTVKSLQPYLEKEGY